MNSHFQILHFVGRLMGKVLMEGERFPIALSPVIYKGLLQQTLRFDDLHEINKDMYDRLAAMRDDTHYFENHPEFEDMLVFAGEIDGKEIALKHNGLNIVVNDENMMGYVEKMFEFQVRKQFKDELTNLLCGFWEVVHPHLIQSFSWSELQILLCGVMELDLDDWRANTKYKSGYSENDQVIKWFWEILQDMTPDERVLILQFVTGSQSVPASGFAGLADTHGALLYVYRRTELPGLQVYFASTKSSMAPRHKAGFPCQSHTHASTSWTSLNSLTSRQWRRCWFWQGISGCRMSLSKSSFRMTFIASTT